MVENYSLSADSFPQGLTKVAAQFEIPMGIEWVKTPETMEKINLTWEHATIHQILESLVKSQPGYDVEIKNDIVHVFPKNWLTDRRNFLNIRIDKFEVQNEFVQFASRRLNQLVNRIVNPRRPSELGGGMAGDWAAGLGDRPVSFKLENATVREILDKLSLAADLKIWIVTYPQNPTSTKTGFRRTTTLYGANPVPDEYQPVWVLLPWGVEPPRE